jgi:hypothetical protein
LATGNPDKSFSGVRYMAELLIAGDRTVRSFNKWGKPQSQY